MFILSYICVIHDFFIYISYYLNKTPLICPGTLQCWQTHRSVQHQHYYHHRHPKRHHLYSGDQSAL